MSIPSDELADLVCLAKVGALPDEKPHLEIVLDTIKTKNISANLQSDNSRALHNALNNYRHFFDQEKFSYFQSVDIYGVDLPIVNAVSRIWKGRRQVVVFSGLLQVVRQFGDLVTVLSHPQAQRADATLVIDGNTVSEADEFSKAGFAVLADFTQSGRAMFAVGDILGRTSRRNVNIGYTSAVLFILAHEFGHLYLRHTTTAPIILRRHTLDLVVDEAINADQEAEFEADRFALLSLRLESRESFISNILFFLGPFAFFEAFRLPSGGTHPLSVNRAANLAKFLTSGTESAAAVTRIIESQVTGFRALAVKRAAGGDLRPNILLTMPISRACQIIAEVKLKIKSQVGYLGLL